MGFMWPTDNFCENTLQIPRCRCRVDAYCDYMRPVYTVNVGSRRIFVAGDVLYYGSRLAIGMHHSLHIFCGTTAVAFWICEAP
ncbi:hypothetical protein LR48_Vigan01g285600 [Vigna angularis]|uniref:Uncharacterized protein n=1 Tax=Phaseolus angularis TaxID=3914 RepID=A0A0L9TRZ4_PHAAN|nr:hypothetical protein LR48_Vigan01g285600 [Vigna angularis]